MAKNGWKHIAVREDTYKIFKKFQGLLMAREERKITEDEAMRVLLSQVLKWQKELEVNFNDGQGRSQ